VSAVGAVWAALHAGHQVGDHLAQTDHQAAGKAAAKNWAGPMGGHVAGYTACQVAALAGLRLAGVRLRPGPVAAALVLSAGTHAFIDRRWPVRWVLQHTGSPQFADLAGHGLNGPYLADQALHTGVLYVAALIASRGAR